MKHFLIINEWASENESYFDIIAIAHSLEEAKEIFATKLEDEKEYAKEQEYEVFEESDVIFDAGEPDYYLGRHTKLYIQMV